MAELTGVMKPVAGVATEALGGQGGGNFGGGQPSGGYGGGAPRPQGGAPRPQQGGGGRQPYPDDEPGPAFPSEASGMDDVPF